MLSHRQPGASGEQGSFFRPAAASQLRLALEFH